MIVLDRITILLPPQVAGFKVVCPFCAQQVRDDDYLSSVVEGILPPAADHCAATCRLGHELRIERAA